MARRSCRWFGIFCSSVALAGAAERDVHANAEQLVWPSSIDAVEAQLRAESVDVRRSAARDLNRLPAAAQRRILPAMFSDPDPEVRLAVADAALSIRLPDAGARVAQWLTDSDVRVREAAAEVLSVLRHPSAVAGLGRMLEDPEPSARAAAATALGNSRSPDATSFLLGHLDDADPEVRHAVVAALSELGDPRAVVPLIGRIQEQRAALRRQAAAALGALGDMRAASALIVALRDGDAGVRSAAAAALGQLRAEDAVWSLSALLETDPDPEVHGAVVDALGAIGSQGALDAILRSLARARPSRARLQRALSAAGESALPSLERCVTQPPAPGAAEICVGALSAIGGDGARKAVERALRENVVGVAQALEALGAIGSSESLPTVLEYLGSATASERKAAIDAAGRLLPREERWGGAVEPIAFALERPGAGPLEQAALLALLGRTRSPRAAPSLIPFAESSDEYLRAVAVEALGQLGPAGADATLLRALESELFPTRWTAALALRRVGRSGSLPELLERLDAAPARERETLAFALAGPLGDDPSEPRVQKVVAMVLESPGPVKDALIEALGRVPAARGLVALAERLPLLGKSTRAKLAEAMGAQAAARPTLLPMLSDPVAMVRANAVWSIGAIGTPKDLDRVAAAVSDRDVAVAANAVGAMALIGARHGADVRLRLCGALEDPRSYVRANALGGLRLVGRACDDLALPEWLLEHHPSDEVRSAAARLLREVGAFGDRAPAALRRCAARDVSGRVAAECSSTPSHERPPSATTHEVEILVVPTGSKTPAPGTAFGLARADGLIRSGISDRRGAVWEPSAPGGQLRLTVPAVFAD